MVDAQTPSGWVYHYGIINQLLPLIFRKIFPAVTFERRVYFSIIHLKFLLFLAIFSILLLDLALFYSNLIIFRHYLMINY